MATKKLLDRFENSPKVWTIKGEFDEKGNYNYVTKIYNSIADAHRDNPKISCSHIEDYCNSTYFSKNNHFFAYEGYYMPFSVENILTGNLWVNDKKDEQNFNYRLLEQLNEKFWNDMAYEFIKDALKSTERDFSPVMNNSHNRSFANMQLAQTLSKLKGNQVSAFMSSLYSNGWKKHIYSDFALGWMRENITRNDLLKQGYDPVVIAEKPEIKYWKTQSYKQENYL